MRSSNYTSLKDNRVIKKHYENFSIAKFLPKENKNAILPFMLSLVLVMILQMMKIFQQKQNKINLKK